MKSLQNLRFSPNIFHLSFDREKSTNLLLNEDICKSVNIYLGEKLKIDPRNIFLPRDNSNFCLKKKSFQKPFLATGLKNRF